MKVLSHPGHGKYTCWIIGNWMCFSFSETFMWVVKARWAQVWMVVELSGERTQCLSYHSFPCSKYHAKCSLYTYKHCRRTRCHSLWDEPQEAGCSAATATQGLKHLPAAQQGRCLESFHLIQMSSSNNQWFLFDSFAKNKVQNDSLLHWTT